VVGLIGLALLAVGIVYGVFFVGIPGPDDPPGELRRQAWHSSLAQLIALAGLLTIVMGSITLIVNAVVYGIWRVMGSVRNRPPDI
jgi:hypothetical protein